MYMIIHGYVIKSTKESHDPPILTKNDSLLLKYINCSKFIFGYAKFLKPGLIKHCHKTLKIIYNNI